MQAYNLESSQAFVKIFNIKPYREGSLSGLTFAVKDNIDIAGMKTSYGSRAWFEAHPAAINHAICIEQLLHAGAKCIGKTVSDEFTYSLDGENYFYGTPINPKVPERIPGGSSSGSASAVACGLVDFAIGTDCAGSIRVPASLCGIFGMRPTAHRISESGVLPFAPSISTVGVFAEKITVLEKAMHVLLRSKQKNPITVQNIYLLEDAFNIAEPAIRNELKKNLLNISEKLNISMSSVSLMDIVGDELDLFSYNENCLRVLQSAEIWNAIGSWIEHVQPEISPRLRFGLDNLKKLDRSKISEALYLREKISTKINAFLKSGNLIFFPTVPVITPLKGELDIPEKAMNFYNRTMAITSFSGIANLPEISIPISNVDGVPIGLSAVTVSGEDEFLISEVSRIFSDYKLTDVK